MYRLSFLFLPIWSANAVHVFVWVKQSHLHLQKYNTFLTQTQTYGVQIISLYIRCLIDYIQWRLSFLSFIQLPFLPSFTTSSTRNNTLFYLLLWCVRSGYGCGCGCRWWGCLSGNGRVCVLSNVVIVSLPPPSDHATCVYACVLCACVLYGMVDVVWRVFVRVWVRVYACVRVRSFFCMSFTQHRIPTDTCITGITQHVGFRICTD